MKSISVLQLQHDINQASQLTLEHGTIAVHEGGQPVFFCLSAKAFSELYEKLGPEEYARVIDQQRNDGPKS